MPNKSLLLIHRWNIRKIPLIKIDKKIDKKKQKKSAYLQQRKKRKSNPIIYRRIRKAAMDALRKLKIRAKKKSKFINKKLIRRKRRHRERLIYRSLRQAMPHVKRIRRRSVRKKKKYKKKRNITFDHALIFKNTRKNSFYSFAQHSEKIKYYRVFIKRKSNIYKRKITTSQRLERVKHTTHRLITSKTIGALTYKGRQKTSPIAKEVFGTIAGETVILAEKKYIVIFFKKKIGRVYRLILKGLGKTPVVVRKITLKHLKSHGFIRARKKRRK